MKQGLLVAVFLMAAAAFGQGGKQVRYTLNDAWVFFKDAAEVPVALAEVGGRDVEIVKLPHTWNAEDAIHGATSKLEGFYRGPAWYLRRVTIPAHYRDKELFVYFEGVNQEADVFVNGEFAGNHIGGYTRFVFPVSRFIDFDTAEKAVSFELAVRADNGVNLDIPTLQADFTFYGGIYRDVSLVATEKVHFNLEDNASNGIFIRTPAVSAEKAELDVDVQMKNSGPTGREVTLETVVYGPDAIQVSASSSRFSLAAEEVLTAKPQIAPIQHPALWSPDGPNLYRLACRLYDANTGKMLDEVVNSFGCRWFTFDAKEGFFLNGEPLKLIGTNRHQDYVNLGNALPDFIHREDVRKMKAMGSNFLRIAHYPQDPAILELCDRLGILTTIETPIIDTITESDAFKENCLNIHLEMMRQNFNHPSLIIRAYMNEVLLHPKYRDDKDRQQAYFTRVHEIASELEALTRREDPDRYTMMPNHMSFETYKDTGLTDLPMIVAWNIYFGWYRGSFDELVPELTRIHEALPDKPMIISEYGAGADPRLHALEPVRFDFTVEYETRYHEAYLLALRELPFVAGMNVWNFADFGSAGRVDAVPNINNKGLIGFDRKPKDVYLFYQAALLETPVIGIAAKTWIRRACVEDEAGKGICRLPVEVFSNEKELELFLNGRSLGRQTIGKHHKAIWEVPFADGDNRLRAVSVADPRVEDLVVVKMDVLPLELDAFPDSGLAINCGDYRFFYDDQIDQAWVPEREYTEGSWGYVGGEVYQMERTLRHRHGTSEPIKGTLNDPLYQTQRVGIQQYRFDVPPGVYEVTLHLAELSGQKSAALPYELTGAGEEGPSTAIDREFSVYLNGAPVIEQINLARDYGSFRSVRIKVVAATEAGEPLVVDFVPAKGEPVINGIELNNRF